MKKLDRIQFPVPNCLSKYKYGMDAWGKLSKNTDDYNEIWDSLLPLQKNLCAYCECILNTKHVEHFFQRNTPGYEHLTFIWENLFGSCCHKERCGKYKDNKFKGSLEEIIKPDIDDPHEYFIFISTGMIVIKEDLNNTKKEKAEQTLLAFNLNRDITLIGSRRRAILSYKPIADEIYKCFESELSNEDFIYFNELINEQIDTIKDQEYSSALKHLFQYNRDY